MAPVNRNSPKRAKSSDSTYTILDFIRDFPDDETCLDYLWRRLYSEDGRTAECPKCGKVRRFHRVKSRPSYSCDSCGHHIHPTAGTIFHKSSTSLHLWFHAVFLMAQTRCGISAKQLEREIGVTYKTAWRMFHQIRSMLVDEEGPFSGTVEMDGAYMGGRGQWRHGKQRTGAPATDDPHRTHVFGIAQRGGNGRSGKVHAHIERRPGKNLRTNVHGKVLPGATVYTDEWRAYDQLDDLYTHGAVDHSKRVYVSGDVHVNTIEGFWSLVKRGISGVYHGVSAQHLQSYLDEYVYRYNHRDDGAGMFAVMLARVIVGPSALPPVRPSA